MRERHPDGIDGPRFTQRDMPEHHPDRVRRVEVAQEGGTVVHTVAEDTATLVLLAGRAAVAPHRWHLVVALDGRCDHDEVRGFAREVAGTLAEAHPEELTAAARKDARGGWLHLDVQRSGSAQTAVAPYSVRARPGAPLATPLTCAQPDKPGTHARRWTVHNVPEQARARPWGPAPRGRSPAPARRKPEALR
ncbi:non-homologous end-joining DNA ligase LigD [Streptomyces lichenis]|uniref:DNA ligase D polymerase domain-containing protein n=1 Tax=Streptomyces lichenis TaxID=2306967 RepID=A0ABT0IDY8_9ACTN|nr:hypothetical protein [Streptomyces lichenis]MCK8679548.1 hypothetical protein [Streptomyces lichenis]